MRVYLTSSWLKRTASSIRREDGPIHFAPPSTSVGLEKWLDDIDPAEPFAAHSGISAAHHYFTPITRHASPLRRPA